MPSAACLAVPAVEARTPISENNWQAIDMRHYSILDGSIIHIQQRRRPTIIRNVHRT